MKRHQALRTPVQKGRAGWNAILGSLPPPLHLEENETADFVVVGAGFAGLAAARRLTQLAPGTRIAVLEAGRIAEGAAGRNSGFMIDLPHNLPGSEEMAARGERELIMLNRHAQDFAEAAVEEYGIDPNFFDRAGKIDGAGVDAGHAANEREKAHLDSIGEPSEMLDAKQMTEVTGSEYYRSGLYTPGTVMLQPAGFIRGVAAGLARAGVRVFEESPASGFMRRDSSWIVSTPKAAVHAGKVILAVNGHLESFGFARGRLMHLFLFGAMTPELSPDQLRHAGGQDRWGITPADHMGATVRRIDRGLGGNRILIRATAALRSGMVPRMSDLARAAHGMQARFDARFPSLAGMSFEHVWAGHACLSRNGVAVMREIDDDVFSACVQNGLGAARGTLTGIGAAELACGESSAITDRFTAECEPARLPPQPFREIGMNAVLRWREWVARKA
ncbi:MAG: FAD-binding oxidoreductase [Boseongicola sp.]|nr:FAD-binding oxidoreductase [Boseongicola sp.]